MIIKIFNKRYIKFLLLSLLAIFILPITLNLNYFTKYLIFYIYPPKQAENVAKQDTIIQEPNTLTYPSLGITAPIQYVQENSETVYQSALKKGVVHFPGSAKVGEVGNCYIFGHSSDYAWSGGEYKTIFAVLTSAKIGDSIFITNLAGKKYEYTVTRTKVVSANDMSVLSQDTQGKKILTLQTSYPIGTALKRFIVVAEIN